MPAFVRRLALGVLLILTAGVVRADNWERFRGPNGDGISSDKNIPIEFSATENVRWKTPIAGLGHSSPVVWGDRLFLQTSSKDASERSLLCLDAKTGKEIWTRSIPAVRPKQKLRNDTSLASATPTTDGEAVYIPFWDGKDVILTAYNFKGDKLWDRNLGEFISQHGPGMSPIIYKDLLIFPSDKDSFRDVNKKVGPIANPTKLLAINKKTGDVVWERLRVGDRACYTVPFVLENKGKAPELIVTSMTAITSYEPESGKPNWEWKWKFNKDALRTIAATTHTNGLLLACSGDGSGERLMVAVAMNGEGKEARPARIWDNPKDFPYVTCMLAKGEHIYFVNDSGRAGCFHANTGKKVWFESLPDAKFYASPVMIDGKIYACSDTGDVYVFAADPTPKYLFVEGEFTAKDKSKTYAHKMVKGRTYQIEIESKVSCSLRVENTMGGPVDVKVLDKKKGNAFVTSPAKENGIFKIIVNANGGGTGKFGLTVSDLDAAEDFTRNRIGGVIRATPAVANGCLYIRNDTMLYCIGNK